MNKMAYRALRTLSLKYLERGRISKAVTPDDTIF